MDMEKKLKAETEECITYQNNYSQLMELVYCYDMNCREKEQLQNSYNNQVQKLENEIDELLCEISVGYEFI